MTGAWPKIMLKTKPTNTAWSAEQAHRDKPGEALSSHGAPGHVVRPEPERHRGEARPHHTESEVRRPHRKHETGPEHADNSQKQVPRPGRAEEHAAQLQPLPGNREHEKADPPRHKGVHGPSVQPQQVAPQPGRRAARHDDGEGHGLNRQHDPEDRDEPEAAGRDEQGAEQTAHPRQREEAADPRQGGGEKGPRSAQGHGAFEADERPQKSAHHERAVGGGKRRLEERPRPAESQ